MKDDETPRSQIKEILHRHYSNLQDRHRKELALLEQLAEQVEKSRLALLHSHAAELNDLREIHRRIDWLVSSKDSPVGDDEE